MENKFKIFVIGLLMSISTGLFAQTSETEKKIEEAKECFQLSKQEWGKKCGKLASLEVEFTNSCNQRMDIKYAIQRTEGRWNIGSVTNVDAGKKCSAGDWVCNATGIIKYWVRPTDQRISDDWPSDKEIRADKSSAKKPKKK